jgi:DNA-binding XRE family transcriptional regulator
MADRDEDARYGLAMMIMSRRRNLGWSRDQLASAAGVSARTIGDAERAVDRDYNFATKRGIETALGWPAGSWDTLRAGEHPGVDLAWPTAQQELGTAGDVLAAIDADPDLLPEAKEHLRNQYGLLRRLSVSPPAQDAEPDVAPPRKLRAARRGRRVGQHEINEPG